MNDKQQIEELAKYMADCETTCDECFEQLESVMTMKIKDREQHCRAYMLAKRAVEQGYRKIPEDSVVIPNKITEETSPETLIKIAKYNEKIRKETAKEVYQELQGHGTTYVKKWIKEQYKI